MWGAPSSRRKHRRDASRGTGTALPLAATDHRWSSLLGRSTSLPVHPLPLADMDIGAQISNPSIATR
jgi:hypothetical protein